MKTIEKENGEALVLRNTINRLRRKREKLDKEIDEKTAEFHRICIHPEDEIEVKNDYIPGSYLDTCQYIKRFYCKICGKKVDEQITHGGYG